MGLVDDLNAVLDRDDLDDGAKSHERSALIVAHVLDIAKIAVPMTVGPVTVTDAAGHVNREGRHEVVLDGFGGPPDLWPIVIQPAVLVPDANGDVARGGQSFRVDAAHVLELDVRRALAAHGVRVR